MFWKVVYQSVYYLVKLWKRGFSFNKTLTTTYIYIVIIIILNNFQKLLLII